MARKLLALVMLAVVGFSLPGCVVYDDHYSRHHYDRGYHDRDYHH